MNENQLYAQMRHAYPVLRRLLPGHGDLDLELVIREVASSFRQRRCATWQEAWNAACGATPGRPGMFRFFAHVRCPDCHGKGFNPRRGGMCATCMTRGRVYAQIQQPALFAVPPELAETPR